MSTWKRHDLKTRAKDVLRVNYWIAFVVALILAISIGSSSSTNNNSQGINYRFDRTTIHDFRDGFPKSFDGLKNFTFKAHTGEFGEFISSLSPALIAVSILAIIAMILFGIAIKVFIFNQLQVGCQKFFVTSAEEPHRNMRHLGLAFKQGNYFPIVKAMFLRGLYTFLWSLLLVIPGIIKAYSYRMVPYILTENPQMDANEAITLSRNMMSGQKWRAFVLDLSFIGWYLLGMLAFGIGVLFVNPYKYSTDAQLYLVLRSKVIVGDC
ncbi:MAG: DUF975 family protein [Clostridiales bacterium]|nr:DUF975 family protein [Clostridiales bacterium]